ncbi:unnamed protein product [Pleuronectes platessa]|uniref:Uncharacterized protein n=1 Tax=Pleuronectes platessa TaxID=8262 RepID=A0A9N7ZF10_PLEPL|nr:unnamed protein product [Pleuronectes platessa]
MRRKHRENTAESQLALSLNKAAAETQLRHFASLRLGRGALVRGQRGAAGGGSILGPAEEKRFPIAEEATLSSNE